MTRKTQILLLGKVHMVLFVLIHFKGHGERLKQWVSMGLVLLVFAIILHFTDAIPINKQLYSFSYVCCEAVGIVFSAFYISWVEMNAMLVFAKATQGIFAGFIKGWLQ